MKKILLVMSVVLVSMACVAEDRPVVSEQLPAPAREFLNANYPGEKISYAVVDDDLVSPDYTVRLANGVEIQFENSGALEKISARTGVPSSVVPVQISDYVKANFPDALIIDYEIGRREYDVELSNGIELKFNGKFRLIGLDD